MVSHLLAQFATAAAISLTLAFSALAADNDLVRLSQNWWGVSIEEFPKKAGLQPGDYSVGDHPSRKGIKVIVINPKAAARWEPKEIPAFEFDFTPEGGLQEIGGFIKGTQKEALAALIARYGHYKGVTQLLGMYAYGWEVGKTELGLGYNLYSLHPAKSKP